MERVKGIEPSYTAWEAGALPLCYTRMIELLRYLSFSNFQAQNRSFFRKKYFSG